MMAYSNDFLMMTFVSLSRVPAARVDPLGQGCAGAEPRRAFRRSGDGVRRRTPALHRIMSASAWRIESLGTPNSPP